MEDSRMCIVCKCCVRVISTIFTYEKRKNILFSAGAVFRFTYHCSNRFQEGFNVVRTSSSPSPHADDGDANQTDNVQQAVHFCVSIFVVLLLIPIFFLLLSFFAFVVNAGNILLSHCRSVYIFLRHLVRRSRMLSILACVPFTILSSTGCRTDGIGRQKWENKVIIIRYIACHMQTSRPNFLHFGRRAACHRSHMWVATGEWWVLVVFGTNYSASESICQLRVLWICTFGYLANECRVLMCGSTWNISWAANCH